MSRPRIEVADIIRTHGDAFLEAYGDILSLEQRRALGDLARCRTVSLSEHAKLRGGSRPAPPSCFL
jgi:hypothetical protein